MDKMKIFIGHDSRFMEASLVCAQSILNYWPEADITLLHRSKLEMDGIYKRKPLKGESTEFSFTRFYVPLLSNYEGISLFCDNDFLWQSDPRDLIPYLKNKKMAVVKHADYTATSNKMNGIENKNYPRKNWSSLMLFNSALFKYTLSEDYLNSATASDLHELRFCDDASIGSIPIEYNCLVGHYNCDNAKALHYTNGGPWFDDYKHAEHSEKWWKIYKSL
jgi:hypothetical protein